MGSTAGAHTEGLSTAFEVAYARGFIQGVAFVQGSSELFDGSSDNKFGIGAGPALRFHRLHLVMAAIAGHGSYVIRESCLLFCDDSRPTERGSAIFVGGHAAWYFAVPGESGGFIIGMAGSLVHDLSSVASQAAGMQQTGMLSIGGYFAL